MHDTRLLEVDRLMAIPRPIVDGCTVTYGCLTFQAESEAEAREAERIVLAMIANAEDKLAAIDIAITAAIGD